MRIITEVKEALYKKGLTLKYLANTLGEKLGKEYTLDNLSKKLNRETITYREMKLIANILGCSLELKDYSS